MPIPLPTPNPADRASVCPRRPKRRSWAILAALAVLLTLSACVPRPAAGPAATLPTACWKFPANPANTEVAGAIYEAFAHLGQAVVDKAGRVACCESGWGPQAVNGQYRGLFQLGSGFDGTIRFYSVKRFGTLVAFAPFDAWVSAQAARDSYVTRGGWSAFACRYA